MARDAGGGCCHGDGWDACFRFDDLIGDCCGDGSDGDAIDGAVVVGLLCI